MFPSMNRLLLVCRTAEARKAVEVCGMAGCSMLSAMPLDQFLFSIPEFFSIPAQGLPRTGRHRSPDRWVSFIAMGGHASGRRCRGREVNPFQRNGDRPSGISCSRRVFLLSWVALVLLRSAARGGVPMPVRNPLGTAHSSRLLPHNFDFLNAVDSRVGALLLRRKVIAPFRYDKARASES